MSHTVRKTIHRIAILDFDDIKNPLLASGQAKATLEVGKRLVQKGHHILVVCSRYPGYRDRTENGIEYKHIGLGSSNIRLNNAVYIFALPFIVRKLNVDIIMECFTAPISTLFTPLWTKIPVVAIPSMFDADRFSELYHFPFYWVERFGLRFYKYFMPYIPYLAEKMKKYNPNVRIKVVPEGVGEEFFSIEKKRPKHILFLGRLDINQKGIDLLLRAYAKIAHKILWPLVIAGNGPDKRKVKKLIQDLGINERVTLLGATYGDAKTQVLEETLFVAFSSRNETFSLFALEALASGLPLVAFDIPGLSWNDSTVALKAEPFNIDDYANLLERLATEKELLSNMGIAARNFARQFTWDNVADQYESFYQEIIDIEGMEKSNI